MAVNGDENIFKMTRKWIEIMIIMMINDDAGSGHIGDDDDDGDDDDGDHAGNGDDCDHNGDHDDDNVILAIMTKIVMAMMMMVIMNVGEIQTGPS